MKLLAAWQEFLSASYSARRNYLRLWGSYVNQSDGILKILSSCLWLAAVTDSGARGI